MFTAASESATRQDIFNIIQKRQNTGVHLKLDEEQWRIARGSKRQAGWYGSLTRYLSGLRRTQMLLMYVTPNLRATIPLCILQRKVFTVSSICMRPDSRSCYSNKCLHPFSFLFLPFLFLWRCRLFRVFWYNNRFSLYGECVLYALFMYVCIVTHIIAIVWINRVKLPILIVAS